MKNKVTAVFFMIVILFLSLNTFSNIKYKLDGIWDGDIGESIIAFDNIASENIAQKNRFININGLFLHALGITYVKDAGGIDTYKLDNGQIMYSLPEQDVTGYVDNIVKLNQYLEESNNGELIYVQLPFKIESDDSMPIGAVEYGNDNADNLIEGLSRNNIANIDIREYIKLDGKNYEKMFFKTDHHWKPEAALWAAGKINEYLAENYGYNYDPKLYDMLNYDVKKYADWFLGSIGKRTGNWYAGVDDINIITPKFQTLFEFKAETRSGSIIERSGKFSDVMFDYSKLEKDYFDVNSYAAYIGGDFSFNTIHNEMPENDRKVLLIRDSFSCTMLPYLALGTEDITAIDLRHYDEMALKDYLDENKFDIILIAYNPTIFSEGMFDFF